MGNDKTDFVLENLDESTKNQYAQELYDFYLLLKKVDMENESRAKGPKSDPIPQGTTEMTAKLHKIEFNGEILQRGFWLYIWQVSTEAREKMFYIGRTGDSSSQNAQSPFNRMSHHLGNIPSSNMLKKHIEKTGLKPAECQYKLVSFGPIFEESKDAIVHTQRRDKVAVLEKGLAEAMVCAGYLVLNFVKSKHIPDEKLLNIVIEGFAKNFSKLRRK